MNDDKKRLKACQERIGYSFHEEALLRAALTHSSSADTRQDSNERMEFLGDAVLGLVICRELIRTVGGTIELLDDVAARALAPRTRYCDARGPAPHEGTLYIVAGSSGQVSGGSLLHSAMYAGLNVHGSLVLDVHGHKLEGSFIDTNGLVRDYFTVTKGADFASKKNDENPEAILDLVLSHER